MTDLSQETKERLVRMWAGLRGAHEASLVDDARRVLETEREVVRAHHRRHLGDDFQPGDEEMGDIHVGDVVHNHDEKGRDTSGLISKGLLVGGMLASGGIGAAVPLIMGALSGQDAPPQTFTDEDTQYELRLGTPDPVPGETE